MTTGHRGTSNAVGATTTESWTSTLRKIAVLAALGVGSVGTLCDGTKNIGFGLSEWGIGEVVASVIILLIGIFAFPSRERD